MHPSAAFDLRSLLLLCRLSITKWIHIHDSDTGLLRFFQSLNQVLRPNGLLFFEPQPDRSYEQARRELSPELRRRARRLRLRMDDFEFLLVEIFGLQKIEMVTEEQQQSEYIVHQSRCRSRLDGLLTVKCFAHSHRLVPPTVSLSQDCLHETGSSGEYLASRAASSFRRDTLASAISMGQSQFYQTRTSSSQSIISIRHDPLDARRNQSSAHASTVHKASQVSSRAGPSADTNRANNIM